MVSRTIQDQQPELFSPTTANSAVQDLEQEFIISDVATCYQDPEPEFWKWHGIYGFSGTEGIVTANLLLSIPSITLLELLPTD